MCSQGSLFYSKQPLVFLLRITCEKRRDHFLSYDSPFHCAFFVSGASRRRAVSKVRSRTHDRTLFVTKLLAATLEAAGRIALPVICVAGRRLAVLATPPRNRVRARTGPHSF